MMTTLIQVERSNKPMLLTATAEAAASSPKISLGRRWLTPFGRGGRFGYSAKAQARQQIGRALGVQRCIRCRIAKMRGELPSVGHPAKTSRHSWDLRTFTSNNSVDLLDRSGNAQTWEGAQCVR